MLSSTSMPDFGLVFYLPSEIYREGDAALGLAYQRHVGVLRLADLVIDQIRLSEDEAFRVAATIVAGCVVQA